MKLMPIMFLVLASVLVANGQIATPQKTLSNIEQFTAKSGRLLQKEFIDVGTVQRVKVQLFLVTDLMDNSVIKGARFEAYVYSAGGGDTKVGVLDADEVDGLIKSLIAMNSSVFTTSKSSYTEVIYQSRGGFEAGAYWSDSKWKTVLKLEKYDSRSRIFMEPKDFETLLTVLQELQARLKG